MKLRTAAAWLVLILPATTVAHAGDRVTIMPVPQLAQMFGDDGYNYFDWRDDWQDNFFGYPHPRPRPRPYHVTCWRGARIIDASGYDRVRAVDCAAPIYGYRAWRNGRPYMVRLQARTGRILSVRRVYPAY